jgi:hypothetical protein
VLEGLRVRPDVTYSMSSNLMSYVSRGCARCRFPYIPASSVSVALRVRKALWVASGLYISERGARIPSVVL